MTTKHQCSAAQDFRVSQATWRSVEVLVKLHLTSDQSPFNDEADNTHISTFTDWYTSTDSIIRRHKNNTTNCSHHVIWHKGRYCKCKQWTRENEWCWMMYTRKLHRAETTSVETNLRTKFAAIKIYQDLASEKPTRSFCSVEMRHSCKLGQFMINCRWGQKKTVHDVCEWWVANPGHDCELRIYAPYLSCRRLLGKYISPPRNSSASRNSAAKGRPRYRLWKECASAHLLSIMLVTV